MKTWKTKLALGLAAIVSAGLMAIALPAAAAIDFSYSHVTNSAPITRTYNGGYVDCPAGKLAVSSGSATSDLRGALLSGSVTTAGTGAFASALGVDGGSLEVRAACVDAARLRGSTTASFNRRESRMNHWGQYVDRATCAEGTVAYGGGGNVVTNGAYDPAGAYTFGTRPEGRSWVYAGSVALGSRSLLTEAHCLPRTRLGTIVTVNRSVRGPNSTSRSRVSVGASCPDGYVAFAGGAWFATIGSDTPVWHGYLLANMMTTNDRGWVAVGDTFSPNTQLTVRLRCTDRLG
jgi:hypothetical protein